MLRVSEVQAMKYAVANNFKLGSVTFNDFEDVTELQMKNVVDKDGEQDLDTINQFDIWANLSIKYEGEVPGSYRVLNSILMDWVDDNEDTLKKIINPSLKKFLQERYKDIDSSELDENFDDFIWEDQVDYIPEINENDKEIDIKIELILDIEEVEEE
jgi:hypothetical protein